MKLREQLIFPSLAATGLLLGLFGALLIHCFFDLQLAQEKSALEARSVGLVHGMEAAAINYPLQNIPLTDEIISNLLTQLDPDAALYAPDGTLLFGSGPSQLPESGIHLRIKRLYAARPVSLGGTVYHLLAFSDLTALYETLSLLLTAFSLLYAAAIALFALIMCITARRLARPIEHLSHTASRLADGDQSVRFPDSGGSTEVHALRASFNHMADSLTGQIERQQRFIADLTHEMKTPLTAMIGHADLIRTGRISGEDAMLAAHRIVREGRRLNALNASLIDLILLGKDEFVFSPVSVRPLLEDTADALRPAAESAGISLIASCADALIEGEDALLRILLANLTDNALKSGAKNVHLGSQLVGGLLTLSVRDDGCGMSEEALQRITEPFYRVDKSRSRAQGGAGLGLALCAEIARIHGSSLSFESAPGSGTAVSLTLPGKEAVSHEDA